MATVWPALTVKFTSRSTGFFASYSKPTCRNSMSRSMGASIAFGSSVSGFSPRICWMRSKETIDLPMSDRMRPIWRIGHSSIEM